MRNLGRKRTLTDMADTFYDFTVRANDGSTVDLSEYRGKVVLVVNTASKCGFTPQFSGLEKLWEQFGDDGLVVLGFPCNQFASQDPGSDGEILEFCQVNYGVTFPMMEKVEVKGAGAHPLFRWLTQAAPGFLGTSVIKWNFTKFLVGRDGQVHQRFAPQDAPAKLAPAIEAALGAGA